MYRGYDKEDVYEALYRTNWVVINDHTHSVEEIFGVGEFIPDWKELCAVYDVERYNLNRIYLDKNSIPHIGQRSIGGEVNGLDFEEYNKSVISDSFRLKRVIFKNNSVIEL